VNERFIDAFAFPAYVYRHLGFAALLLVSWALSFAWARKVTVNRYRQISAYMIAVPLWIILVVFLKDTLSEISDTTAELGVNFPNVFYFGGVISSDLGILVGRLSKKL
jgi:hypothetical protein